MNSLFLLFCYVIINMYKILQNSNIYWRSLKKKKKISCSSVILYLWIKHVLLDMLVFPPYAFLTLHLDLNWFLHLPSNRIIWHNCEKDVALHFCYFIFYPPVCMIHHFMFYAHARSGLLLLPPPPFGGSDPFS